MYIFLSGVADPRLRPCGVWRRLRRVVTLHRCDTQHVPSLRPAAVPSTAQAVTSPSSLVCSCSLVPAGKAVAALHRLGRCHSTDQVPGSRRLSFAWQDLCVFPSKFRLEHDSTAWLCLLRGPGPLIIPGDHSPDFPLMGRKFYGWPQGSAVSDTRCGTAV